MKLRYILSPAGVVDAEDHRLVFACQKQDSCEEWLMRHQEVSPVQLSAGQIKKACATDLPLKFNPATWHSCDALGYLAFIELHPAATVVEVSSKRSTEWRGMSVAFNKAKDKFWRVLCAPKALRLNVNGGLWVSNVPRVGFAPQMLCEPLDLNAAEEAELLLAWRHGKAEWYRSNATLPLRCRAEAAKKLAIATPP